MSSNALRLRRDVSGRSLLRAGFVPKAAQNPI
jgi:hypothetical protein